MIVTLTTICLCWMLTPQSAGDPPTLSLGVKVEAVIPKDAPGVQTPILDAKYNITAPPVGNSFRITPPTTGTYHFDLHSFAFDCYLILRAADGTLLAEDDDGFLSSHSRIIADLQANTEYQITACALHGGRGSFQVQFSSGLPAPMNPEEKRAASLADTVAKIQWLEKVFGTKSSELANALVSDGHQFQAQGRYAEAEVAFGRMLEITEEFFSSELTRMAASMNFLARLYDAQGRLSDALPLYERALPIWVEALGPENPNVAASKSNLAEAYRKVGRFSEAEPLFLDAISIIEKSLGPDHPNNAAFHNNLATLYKDQGRYSEAEPLAMRSVEIAEKIFGRNHINVASCLNTLAVIYKKQGRYQEVEVLFKRGLNIAESALGKNHPDVAIRLNNLAMVYQDQGLYAKAEPISRRALAINEEFFGPENSATGLSVDNLAMIVKLQGRYAEAEPLMERALQIRKKVYGVDHPDYAVSLNNLGMFYQERGRYSEAEPFLKQGLEIVEKAFGSEHPTVAVYLNNLASFYRTQKRYPEAIELFRRSLAIRERTLAPDHTYLADSLDNLAKVDHIQGLYAEAEPKYLRALSIRKKAVGQDHPQVAIHLNNLGALYRDQGLYAQAKPFAERALAIWESAYGSGHPHVAGGLHNLAGIQLQLGNAVEALSLFDRALRGLLLHLDRELPTQSEADRFRILSTGAGPEQLLQCLLETDAEKEAEVFDLFLQWKGKLTRLQTASLALTQSRGDSEAQRRIGQLQSLQKQLSTLVFLPSADQAEDHAERVAELRNQRLTMEREINRTLNLDELLQTPAHKELQGVMATDSVLIDFFVGTSVYAWILHPTGDPLLIDLGEAVRLRDAQTAYLTQSVRRGGKSLEAGQADPAIPLGDLLWQPLKDQIGEAKTLLISPDGFLCELPFGMMKGKDKRYLLESYRMVYHTDASHIAAVDGPPVDGTAIDREGPMLAVGDVNYYRADVSAEGNSTDVEVAAESENSTHTRSRIGEQWASLASTRQEIAAIRDLRKYVLEWESGFQQLDDTAATEENVRRSIAGQRYVHIATHGYFEPDHLPSLLSASDADQAQDLLGEQRKAVGLLPGLLSGLVFAGVNAKADPNRDDGYLSAEEIQYLDLSACDLAVLSACETALGSQRAGEGLMSLRRAFEVAGAKTVVSSLWKVDDRATATLMAQFYKNYWELGMGKGEALHQAKLRMLRQNRADFGEPHPETWGAFVLSGDWN
ncbi:MAG: tetratricopeptide repeat protein [Planctomycetes bacterium]|nr:tetratricopeptide repeat protein [Planctomycetota bacterium]